MGRGEGPSTLATAACARTATSDTLEQLGLSLPDEELGFRHIRSEEWPGLLLLVPAKGGMMRYSDWSHDLLPFRSLVVREEEGRHQIVSSGFPKFFNWGEAEDETALMASALERGAEVSFTEKLDGSLVIRSVIDGRVMWRTRGQLGMGDHQAALQEPLDRYPQLRDPGFHPEASLLFELTSPRFQIVLPHDRDELTLLGAIDHTGLRQHSRSKLEEISYAAQMPLVPAQQLPTDPAQLLAEVSSWKGREGVVLRLEREDQNPLLLKLKSREYLVLHRLRESITARSIRQICLDQDVRTLEDFEDYLYEQGADWEVASGARPLVNRFLTAREGAECQLAALREEVEEKRSQLPERHDFAIQYANKLPASDRTAAYLLFSGQQERAAEWLLRSALDREFGAD